MLIAAADTSDNWKYVSIIIGSYEDIKAIYRTLNCKDIHMRQLSSIEKNNIIKGLTIKGDSPVKPKFALCHRSYFLSGVVFEFVFVDGPDKVSELVFTILSFIVPITPDTELAAAVGVESVATFSLFIN